MRDVFVRFDIDDRDDIENIEDFSPAYEYPKAFKCKDNEWGMVPFTNFRLRFLAETIPNKGIKYAEDYYDYDRA